MNGTGMAFDNILCNATTTKAPYRSKIHMALVRSSFIHFVHDPLQVFTVEPLFLLFSFE